LSVSVFSTPALFADKPAERTQVLDTMKRATRFMVEKVSCQGGYVWSYLPDFSRRWGELEARPSQIWIQPPGTGSMGHLFLDAYHATGDEYYYSAAEKVAEALMAGQHPSGGWNYLVDFAGPDSLREWYATIGKNAWRLEEFQHYCGNATFDDGGTSECAKFFLRLYLEKHDAKYRPPLERVLKFVLDSQYPSGGWPQRYPLCKGEDSSLEYSAYLTFNDDVSSGNIEFLLLCHQALPELGLREAILRAMNVFVISQGKPPQSGWGLQCDPVTFEPMGARSYEPKALATHTTAQNVEQLMRFYEMTGDPAFLAGVPAALAWLDAVRVNSDAAPYAQGRSHPTFVELGTNQPLYLHRAGSNVQNGRYFTDHDPRHTIGHYASFRFIDTEALRKRFQKLRQLDPDALRKKSPLAEKASPAPLPRFFVLARSRSSDLNSPLGEESSSTNLPSRVDRICHSLNAAGYWPTPLHMTSHAYRAEGPKEMVTGDFGESRVGDETDTSPYMSSESVQGISTGAYIQRMATLIEWVDQNQLR
jgi:PelA/Pel-15E family pectate lyase